jgi:Ca2+/H+ antiporter, TMEM165/GDT1 family
MNALMVALVVALLATPGGRWWWLARGESLLLVVLSAALACAVAAWGGQWVAATVRGPGMQLLLALAIIVAGGGLLWPSKPVQRGNAPLSLRAIRLTAAAWSDAAPFVVFAAAAWAREPLLAGLGGAVGMIATILLGREWADDTCIAARLGWLRAGIGALLLIVGTIVALLAMQLL